VDRGDLGKESIQARSEEEVRELNAPNYLYYAVRVRAGTDYVGRRVRRGSVLIDVRVEAGVPEWADTLAVVKVLARPLDKPSLVLINNLLLPDRVSY